MRTDDFDYFLPEELVAQEPSGRREQCRLLHLERARQRITHRGFGDLVDLLREGDRLVLNDTKVIPARLFCRKRTGARIELLLTEPAEGDRWYALVKPSRRLREGDTVDVEGSGETCSVRIGAAADDGQREVGLAGPCAYASIAGLLEARGRMPLPHYIQRDDIEHDRTAYQTVYARNPGAVAAPTAGLHFSDELLGQLAGRGVDRSFLTLHVGIGTFRPVKVDDPREHQMHEEAFVLPGDTAAQIEQTRERGGRIIAVGTTVVRVLEHCAQAHRPLAQCTGRTRMMILPGHQFRAVDALITNFHLPRSTLLMLVSAFAGRESVLAAYAEAVRERYRFFSYGDAMFIA